MVYLVIVSLRLPFYVGVGVAALALLLALVTGRLAGPAHATEAPLATEATADEAAKIEPIA